MCICLSGMCVCAIPYIFWTCRLFHPSVGFWTHQSGICAQEKEATRCSFLLLPSVVGKSLICLDEGARNRFLRESNTPSLLPRRPALFFLQVLLYLDKLIGEFFDVLEQEGWLDYSIFVMASDNGACPSEGGSNYPLRGTKASVHEGGTMVTMSTKCFPTKLPSGSFPTTPNIPFLLDLYLSFGCQPTCCFLAFHVYCVMIAMVPV